jgi:hypothetical protein
MAGEWQVNGNMGTKPTIEEFFQEHPAQRYRCPLVLFIPIRKEPNTDFV